MLTRYLARADHPALGLFASAPFKRSPPEIPKQID